MGFSLRTGNGRDTACDAVYGLCGLFTGWISCGNFLLVRNREREGVGIESNDDKRTGLSVTGF